MPMPTLYTQDLNGKGEILKQRLEKFAKTDDILSCREEVILQQSVLQDRVEEYAAAIESGDKGAKAGWGNLVSEEASKIISSKERMAKIEQWRAQHITRETLFMLVRNIADMLYQNFAVNEEWTEKVADIVNSIESGVLGTSTGEVSEAELFAEMVQTVPMIEVDSNP